MKNANHLKRTEVSHLSLFCGAFVLSSLGILLLAKESVMQSDVLDRNTLSLFRVQGTNRLEMLLYILRERCLILPLLFVLATTYLGKWAGYVYCAWYGAGIGAVVGTGLLRYGLGGVFLVLGSAFPQYLFYVPAFIISIGIAKNQRKPERRFAIQLLLMELLVIAGCFAECYINPSLMEKIIKLFGIK
ncbi:MAG: stage II sporulation protein M [Lachnospiraceae bacterium]|nr:stage II sporulation protein M [Lachnospiraceae bacterium]